MSQRNLILLGLCLLFTACSSSTKTSTDSTSELNSLSTQKNYMKLPKKAAVINFNFDSATITTHETHHLSETLTALNKAPKNFIILVKGHTDRIGSHEYNHELGLQRAKSVKQALILRGVDENKIRAISYGENNPIILTNNDEKRQKNRRAIIEIVPADKQYSHTTISMNK